MSMSKKEVLREAANIIEKNATALRESHAGPARGSITDEKVAIQFRREMHIASKLREYALRT